MSMNVKKNDTVVVLSGKDKGKQGKVLSVDPTGGKVLVEKVNVASKHQKPRQQGQEGGIIQKETPIYACKVMTVCPKCSKAPPPPPQGVGRQEVPGWQPRGAPKWGWGG